MEKFNLERALAGEPVITRNGKEVTQLVKFDGVKYNEVIVGVLNETVHFWTLDGKWNNLSEIESISDLFMKPKENAIWVNLYKSIKGHIYIGEEFKTEKEAIDDAKEDIGFIRTIKIVE